MAAEEAGGDVERGVLIGALAGGLSGWAGMGLNAGLSSVISSTVLRAAVVGFAAGAVGGTVQALFYGGDARAVLTGAAVSGILAAGISAIPELAHGGGTSPQVTNSVATSSITDTIKSWGQAIVSWIQEHPTTSIVVGVVVGGAVVVLFFPEVVGLGGLELLTVEGGTTVLGSGGAAGTFAELVENAPEEEVSVYEWTQEGKQIYEGITSRPDARLMEQLKEFGDASRKILGQVGTRLEARAIETRLIQTYGMASRGTGILLNQRFSISPDHPWFEEAMQYAEKVLQEWGYELPQ